MKSALKGWLKEYLDFRKDISPGPKEDTIKRHPDESLYEILQPTGLLYGQPVEIPGAQPQDLENLETRDRLKILLAESFINSALLLRGEDMRTPDDFSRIIMETVNQINSFYQNVYPELSTSKRTFLGRKKKPLELAEQILEKRVGLNESRSPSFWVNFFSNSLLFLDIYFFGQWVHTNSEKMISEYFISEKEELRFTVIKVITAAAHANNIIEIEERTLFEYFLESAGLSPEREKEAHKFLSEGVDLDDMYLPTSDSWILKKYFLELAILTVWADKRVEDSEIQFLESFSRKLGFYDDDLEHSMLAVEGFVLEHWTELTKLQQKHDYKQVSKHYLDRLSNISEKNKVRIEKEIHENHITLGLLDKLMNKNLKPEEEITLKENLIEILKSIPSFVIIALPSTYLTLPLLLKILPDSVYPKPEANEI